MLKYPVVTEIQIRPYINLLRALKLKRKHRKHKTK